MGKFYVFFYVFLTVSVVLNAFVTRPVKQTANDEVQCEGGVGSCGIQLLCCDKEFGGGCCPKDYKTCCSDAKSCCPGVAPICCSNILNGNYCCNDEAYCCLQGCCFENGKFKSSIIKAKKREGYSKSRTP